MYVLDGNTITEDGVSEGQHIGRTSAQNEEETEQNGSMNLNETQKNDGSHEQHSLGTIKMVTKFEKMSDAVFLNRLKIDSEAFEDEINFEHTEEDKSLKTVLEEGLMQELEEHNGVKGQVDLYQYDIEKCDR